MPFDGRAHSLTRANAWWLAESALLSYWDPDTAKRLFAGAGLQATFVEEGDTQAYVASGDGFVIVAFRGITEHNGALYFTKSSGSNGLHHHQPRRAVLRVRQQRESGDIQLHDSRLPSYVSVKTSQTSERIRKLGNSQSQP